MYVICVLSVPFSLGQENSVSQTDLLYLVAISLMYLRGQHLRQTPQCTTPGVLMYMMHLLGQAQQCVHSA
jgi:hypothetical protein